MVHRNAARAAHATRAARRGPLPAPGRAPRLLLAGLLAALAACGPDAPQLARRAVPTTAIERATAVRERLEATTQARITSAERGAVDATEAVIDDVLPGRARVLGRAVQNLALPGEDARALFVERVAVADVAEPHGAEALEAFDVEVRHWPVTAEREVERDALRLWAALLESVERFENASFKVVRGTFLDEQQTRLRTSMKFAGLAHTGERWRDVHAVLEVDWVRVPGDGEDETPEWRIAAWRTEHLETEDTERLFFRDVLATLVDGATLVALTEPSAGLGQRIAVVHVNLEAGRTIEDVRTALDDGILPFTRAELDAVLARLDGKRHDYVLRLFGQRARGRQALARLLEVEPEELAAIDREVRGMLQAERRRRRPEVAERIARNLDDRRQAAERQGAAEGPQDPGSGDDGSGDAELPKGGGEPSSMAIAVADVDRDGLDDLWVARNARCFLLRNRGDGSFEDVAARMDLPQSGAHGLINQALFVDLDNDGDLDLLLGFWDGLGYFRNEDGRFVDRTRTLLDSWQPVGNVSLSAADYDGDGLLDVYVGTRDMFRPAEELLGRANLGFDDGTLFGAQLPEAQARRYYQAATSEQADPTFHRPGPPNQLLHNEGGGLLALAPDSEHLEVYLGTHHASWSDYDGDGDQDLYVANDFGPNNLFRNDGGRLVDVTEETGTADVGFGMGVSWGDYDNDGDQDLYVTNMYSKAGLRISAQADLLDSRVHVAAHGNTLLRNDGGRFVKVSGTEPPALLVEPGGWGWGAQLVDLDNDGFLDVYAPSGYLSRPPGFSAFADT